MVYYKNCLGFPTKTAVIISSFLALIFYTLLVIFMTTIYGITIYYGDENPFRAQMDYFLGSDWDMMVLDLVFGLFWIAIIFGFVTQLLLLYGIQKLNEAFMLPHLILKLTGLIVRFFNVFKNISFFQAFFILDWNNYCHNLPHQEIHAR